MSAVDDWELTDVRRVSLMPQSSTLRDFEKIVERGLGTFLEVGAALAEIRHRKLYPTTYGDGGFDAYCRERWGMDRTYAHRLIQSAEVANVLPTGNTLLTERVARELAPLRDQPEELRETWAEAVAEFEQPTAAQVREVVKRRQAPEPAPAADLKRRRSPEPPAVAPPDAYVPTDVEARAENAARLAVERALGTLHFTGPMVREEYLARFTRCAEALAEARGRVADVVPDAVVLEEEEVLTAAYFKAVTDGESLASILHRATIPGFNRVKVMILAAGELTWALGEYTWREPSVGRDLSECIKSGEAPAEEIADLRKNAEGIIDDLSRFLDRLHKISPEPYPEDSPSMEVTLSVPVDSRA